MIGAQIYPRIANSYETDHMKKREFTAFLAKKNGFTINYAEKILSAFLASMEDALFRDGRILLPGFGVFEAKNMEAREGRNPATGEAISLPAGKKIVFRPSASFKELIN